MDKIKQFTKNIGDKFKKLTLPLVCKVKAFMAQGHNLLITQIAMCAISFFLNIWGILSLCNVIDLFHMSAFNYFDNIALIPRYVLIIINMAVGIELFCFFANTLKGKQKTIWLIVNCAYSTILTVPLLYTFLALFAAPSGTLLPMVDLIYAGKGGFGDIPSVGVQYFVFVLGTIMSAVFLAVPILSCVGGVKKNIKSMQQQLDKNCECDKTTCNCQKSTCDCNTDNKKVEVTTTVATPVKEVVDVTNNTPAKSSCNCDTDNKKVEVTTTVATPVKEVVDVTNNTPAKSSCDCNTDNKKVEVTTTVATPVKEVADVTNNTPAKSTCDCNTDNKKLEVTTTVATPVKEVADVTKKAPAKKTPTVGVTSTAATPVKSTADVAKKAPAKKTPAVGVTSTATTPVKSTADVAKKAPAKKTPTK